MEKQRKKKRRLKKSVKITGCALLLAMSGITLVTSIKHFAPIKNDTKEEQDDNDFLTAGILENIIDNYYSDNKTSYSCILKNKTENSYIFSNSSFANDDWEVYDIEDNDEIFEELIALDYNQVASYSVLEQVLLIKEDTDSVAWKNSGQVRIVPESVPEFVFEGEDKCWHITNKKVVVDDKYNIFEFMQVYTGSDGSLFIGLNEPNIINNIYWEYSSSLTDFIEKNRNFNNVKELSK